MQYCSIKNRRRVIFAGCAAFLLASVTAEGVSYAERGNGVVQPGDPLGSGTCTAGPAYGDAIFAPVHCVDNSSRRLKVDGKTLKNRTFNKQHDVRSSYLPRRQSTSIAHVPPEPDRPVAGVVRPQVGMLVFKSGMTSGTSSGTISWIAPDSSKAYVQGMLQCRGDSGAPVYTYLNGNAYIVGMATEGNGSINKNGTLTGPGRCGDQAYDASYKKSAGLVPIDKMCEVANIQKCADEARSWPSARASDVDLTAVGNRVVGVALVPGSGTWEAASLRETNRPDASLIDPNRKMKAETLTSTSDGALHIGIVVDKNGLWFRSKSRSGTWGSGQHIDKNPNISDVAMAATPDDVIHLAILVPGSGIWYKSRSKEGKWTKATKIDKNPKITDISLAATPDGAVHLAILVPGSGIWYTNRSTEGKWAQTAKIDKNPKITDTSLTATPDGAVHLAILVPGSGIWYTNRSTEGKWAQTTKIDKNGKVRGTALTATDDGVVHLGILLPGNGIWYTYRNTSGRWAKTTRY